MNCSIAFNCFILLDVLLFDVSVWILLPFYHHPEVPVVPCELSSPTSPVILSFGFVQVGVRPCYHAWLSALPSHRKPDVSLQTWQTCRVPQAMTNSVPPHSDITAINCGKRNDLLPDMVMYLSPRTQFL